MRIRVATVVTLVVSIAGAIRADATVIAGSGDSPTSPPSFWTDSFWGVTSSIEMAFPFTLVVDQSCWLEALDVAAYRYEGLGGMTADFSITRDDGGLPGEELAVFHVQGITLTPQVLSATLQQDVALDPGVQYWIVGSTDVGQVNWNLGDYVFGPRATCVNDGDWTYSANGNVSAFTIRGTQVPEPSVGLLLGCVLIPVVVVRRT